jgi:hypothetical protein
VHIHATSFSSTVVTPFGEFGEPGGFQGWTPSDEYFRNLFVAAFNQPVPQHIPTWGCNLNENVNMIRILKHSLLHHNFNKLFHILAHGTMLQIMKTAHSLYVKATAALLR